MSLEDLGLDQDDLDQLGLGTVQAEPQEQKEPAPADPTPADPTPSEPTPAGPTSTETPSFDFSVLGEGFTSQESVLEFIEKSRQNESQLSEAQKKLESLTSQPNFHDETLFKLDQVKRTRPDDFEIAKKIALGTMPDVDLLIIQEERNSDVFKGWSDEEKRAYIEDKYSMSHDLKPLSEEDGFSEQEVAERAADIAKAERRVAADRRKLSLDAEKARRALEGDVFNGIEVPVIETPEEKAQKAEAAKLELIQSWEAPMKEVMAMKAIDIKFPGKDGKETSVFQLEIPSEGLKKYTDEFKDYVLKAGVSPEDVSVQNAQAYIEKRFRDDDFPKIAHEIAVRSRGLNEEQWRNFIFSPSKPANPEDRNPDSSAAVKSTESEIERALKNW